MEAKLRSWMPVALPLVLLCGLTLPFIGRQGFWFDEIFALEAASSWSHLWSILTTQENNMALYFALLCGWTALGDSEFMVRLLSVVCALVAIPMFYQLARQLFDGRVAVIASVLLAINPLFLYHAQEARSYALLALLSITGSVLLISGLRQPRMGTWIGYAVCMAATVYAHYFGLLTVLAHAVAVLLPGAPPLRWRRCLPAGVVCVFLIAPLFLFRPITAGQVDWIEPPDLGALVNFTTLMAGGRSAAMLCLVGIVLTAVYYVRQASSQRTEERWPIWFALSCLLVPVLVTLVFSFSVKPVFITKYLIATLPATLLLVAVGVARLPTWCVVITVVLFLAVVLGRYAKGYIGPGEPWREVARHVVAQAQPGDGVICYPYYHAMPFSFYARRAGADPTALVPIGIASAAYNPGGGSVDPNPDFTAITAAVAQHRRLWLVVSFEKSEKLNRVYRSAIQERIESVAINRGQISFPNPLSYDQFDIILYEPITTPDANAP